MGSVTVNANKDATGLKGLVNNGADNAWSGSEKHLSCGKWVNIYVDPQETYLTRSLVGFSIPFAANWTGITSATLKLTQRPNAAGSNRHANPATGTSLQLNVFRMLTDWREGNNNGEYLFTTQTGLGYTRKCTNDNTNNFTFTDSVAHTFTQSDNNVEEVNVTAIVTKWFEQYKGTRSNAPNYGFILAAQDESSTSESFDFFSRNNGSSVPQLTVVFTTGTDTDPGGGGGDAPTGTITAPVDAGTISTTVPHITWTYSDPNSKAQESTRILVWSSSGVLLHDYRQMGTATNYDIPDGIITDGNTYDIEIRVRNTDLIADSDGDTVTVTCYIAEAAPPITGLVATAVDEGGYIGLTWDQSVIPAGQVFLAYNVYRKRSSTETWTRIAQILDINTPSYDDFWAGYGVMYDYRLTLLTQADDSSGTTPGGGGGNEISDPGTPPKMTIFFQWNSTTTLSDVQTAAIEFQYMHITGVICRSVDWSPPGQLTLPSGFTSAWLDEFIDRGIHPYVGAWIAECNTDESDAITTVWEAGDGKWDGIFLDPESGWETFSNDDVPAKQANFDAFFDVVRPLTSTIIWDSYANPSGQEPGFHHSWWNEVCDYVMPHLSTQTVNAMDNMYTQMETDSAGWDSPHKPIWPLINIYHADTVDDVDVRADMMQQAFDTSPNAIAFWRWYENGTGTGTSYVGYPTTGDFSTRMHNYLHTVPAE